MPEASALPNLDARQIDETDELVVVGGAHRTGANILVGVFADWIESRDGMGVTTAEDAWIKANAGRTIAQWRDTLPRWQDAHPDAVVGLQRTDGGQTPGIYELVPGNARPKTAGFEVVVSFADDGSGGLVWDATHGSISGKPVELRRILVDPAGLAMTMYIDTDVGQPSGPGNLTVEIRAPNYSFNPKLIQQDFNVAEDQEIQFLGTIATGLQAGEAVHIHVLFGEENVPWFQPAEPVWTQRVSFTGEPGADGWTFTPHVAANGDLTWTVARLANAPDAPAARNIRGPEGPQGIPGTANTQSGAHAFASNAEAEAGAVTDKVISPASLLAVIRAKVRDFAETDAADKVEAADAGTTITDRLLPAVTDADQDMGKIPRVQPSGAYGLEDYTAGGLDQDAVDARITALVRAWVLRDTTITDAIAAQIRALIKAEEEGADDYVEAALGDFPVAQGAVPDPLTGRDSNIDVPQGAKTLRLRAHASGTFASVDVTTLLGLTPVDATTALTNANSIEVVSPGGFQDDDAVTLRVAHGPNRRLFVAVDQAGFNGSITVRSRRPRQADWDETDPNSPDHILHKPTTITPAERRKLATLAPQVPADWDATSGPARILHKPNITSAPTPVQALPARGGEPGDRYELLQTQTGVANPIVATPTETRDAIGFTLPVTGRSRAIALFGYQKTGSSAGRLIVGRIPAETRTPAAAVVDGVEYALHRQAGIGATDYISAVLGTPPLAGDTPADINVRFTDGSWWLAPQTLNRAYYEWTGHVYDHVTAPLTDAATFAKLQDGVVGFSVTTDRNQQTTLRFFTADAYILPEAHVDGVMFASAQWSSPNTDNLTVGTPTHHRLQVFLSELRALDAFADAQQNGIRISSVPVRNASGTHHGDLELWLARNAANQFGFFGRYIRTVNTGGVGPYALQAQVEISLLRAA